MPIIQVLLFFVSGLCFATLLIGYLLYRVSGEDERASAGQVNPNEEFENKGV